MKVKIGDKVFTPKDGPIMVILSEQDKVNISKMGDQHDRYMVWDNENNTKEEAEAFLNSDVLCDCCEEAKECL